MDRVAPDPYSQSASLPPADSASAAQYTPQQEGRANNYHPPATPTAEYNANPGSARSANFPPDYLARQQQQQQQQHYAQNSHAAASMAQATSPSMSLPDGNHHNHHHTPSIKSNPDVPIDPSIAQSSPTFPGPYSPYAPQGHEMAQYPGHPPQGYGHWPGQGYGHPHGLPGGPYSSPGSGVSPGGQNATAGPPRPGQPPHPLSQVYSFVPIPGAQQHKRPRRRYEEIERMYKCGHQGCEKAYGTLNHLNAHVTMQSHGQKRTPEEFKEIRKEWKARKKEEENARKAEEERHRSSIGGPPVEGNGSDPSQTPTSANYPPGVRPQLPPIGYAPAGGQVAGQYPGGPDPMYGQAPNGAQQMYSSYPHSPYNQGGQVYQQHPDTPNNFAP
ncbi:hypothetical protein MMC19_004850 [Ptychographa xylographoides]|nr:hypothetical protein [Ptychographa xylographoides]